MNIRVIHQFGMHECHEWKRKVNIMFCSLFFLSFLSYRGFADRKLQIFFLSEYKLIDLLMFVNF